MVSPKEKNKQSGESPLLCDLTLELSFSAWQFPSWVFRLIRTSNQVNHLCFTVFKNPLHLDDYFFFDQLFGSETKQKMCLGSEC